MDWYTRKMRRRALRGEAGSEQRRRYLEGRRRRQGFSVVMGKKRDPETEIVEQVVAAVAKDGCFGDLLKFDKDLHEEWALGTSRDI